MKVCPNAALNESPVAPQMEDLVKEVLNVVRKKMGGDSGSVEEIEDQLLETLREIGGEVLKEVLEDLDPPEKEIQFGGQTLCSVLRSQESYLSRFGMIRIRRTLFRAAGRNTPTICPLEIKAGIMDGLWLSGAARAVAMAMADLTAQDAHRLFKEMGLMCPSVSCLSRLPAVVSAQWEAERELHESMLRDQERVPQRATAVCISVDGVLAPMKDKAGQRQVKRAAPGKHGSGPSGYREVGCGTLSFHDDQSERLQTIYQGRMPESKKATLHQWLEDEVLQIHATRPDLRRVYLADGAEINWQIANSIEAAVRAQCEHAGTPYEPALEVVDFYHACEHLKRGCDAIFGEGNIKGKLEFKKLRNKLKEEDRGADLVINALRYRLGTIKLHHKRLAAELTYFRNQRARMDYARYRRDQLPIASGVVEAACKTLVTQRMKRSGMAWSQAGGQAILTIRAWLRSDRFDAAWQIITNRVKNSVADATTYDEPRLRLAA